MKAFTSRNVACLTCLGAIVVSALCAPGCGVSSASSNAVQVWGRVTCNGKPVTGGVIIFMPGPTGKAWGTAPISSDGKYTLVTYDATFPFEPGRYTIFILPPGHKVTRRQSRFEEENAKPATENEAAATPKYEVPERFFRPDTSGLWVELDKEPNRVDIDLKD